MYFHSICHTEKTPEEQLLFKRKSVRQALNAFHLKVSWQMGNFTPKWRFALLWFMRGRPPVLIALRCHFGDIARVCHFSPLAKDEGWWPLLKLSSDCITSREHVPLERLRTSWKAPTLSCYCCCCGTGTEIARKEICILCLPRPV